MSKLHNIKKALKAKKIDALFVPMADNFGSEYLSTEFRYIEYLSDFSGSNAFLVINAKGKAAFFTDGRYTTQAALEVSDKDFDIFDLSEQNEIEYIKGKYTTAKIAFNGSFFSCSKIKNYKETLGKNFKLEHFSKKLLDEFWENKPISCESEVFELAKKFSGKDYKTKLSKIFAKANAAQDSDVDYLFLNNAEAICWALNIRAHDLPSTPVLLSYVLISKKFEITLFCHNKVTPNKHLSKKFSFKNISEFESEVQKLSTKTILIDESEVNFKAYAAIEKSKATIIVDKNPIIELKAIKNNTEVKNAKLAHEKDGAALVKFFHWLEGSLAKKQKIDELLIDEKLIEFRSRQPNFFSTSFDTIAGFKGNGAIIHYRANQNSNQQIKGNGLLLIDSGGQYFEGTTDITRTIAIGNATAEEKRNFTLVLKGHIALAKVKFASGTYGANLDILARQYLWQNALDYKHGTGHGVGSFLNVHEGPMAINMRNKYPLKNGMVISNEPGYYSVGKYGIRIESLVLVRNATEKGFLEFETLSLCPIDLKLVDKKLLDSQEVVWLNNYHKNIFAKLKKYLQKDELAYLKQKTKDI